MRLRLSSYVERLRASLFFVPMLNVLGAIALGLGLLWADRRLSETTTTWPIGLTSTVESARALLSTVAGATITFAGIAFSVSLLTIQLASSQYSPRIVHTLFRDPFNKRVMGLVVGTFTYSLIVLRSVRSALDAQGTPVIPNLSVAVALLLGIITILAIVAFINHSAHAMDVSEILERVRREATAHIRQEWTLRESGEPAEEFKEREMPRPNCLVRFDRAGWVQQIDMHALMTSVPAGSTLRLETIAGRYAIEGTPLCVVSPPPPDIDAATRALGRAIAIGNTRTMQQDVSYGLRQLVDVALKALSPGVNDPTTAQDAIFHASAVLHELLRRKPPGRIVDLAERRLLVPQQLTAPDLVRLAFEETRRAAAGHPAVCIYLLEAIDLLRNALADNAQLAESRTALDEQARLVLEGCEASDLIAPDLDQVRRAYAHRFLEV